MNENELHDDSDASLEAPPRLVDALKKIPREEIFVPPHIDRAIAAAARRRLEKSGGSPGVFRRWVLWPALAAACVLIVMVVHWNKPVKLSHTSQGIFSLKRVDILDAFALARQLRDGRATTPSQDLNGDGVVDQKDVEIIARRAVSLQKGGRS